jgi:hypothetical protein
MANCPFCRNEINAKDIVSEYISSTAFKFGKEMYSCPNCNEILGFASRGLIMQSKKIDK